MRINAKVISNDRFSLSYVRSFLFLFPFFSNVAHLQRSTLLRVSHNLFTENQLTSFARLIN